MRYWKTMPRTLHALEDWEDAPHPDAVEINQAEYDQLLGQWRADFPVFLTRKATSLIGNNKSYVASPEARRVSVHVNAPVSGAVRTRPTIDGYPVIASGAPYVFDFPGTAITVETNAGNNDVVVVEEF